LIELLVVVSIIALLVSILLPALNRARETAKFVVCSTQMHQMGIAEIQYAHDYDGRFTPGDHIDGLVIAKHAHLGVPSGPTNMGHLLEGDYLPLPGGTKECLLWCPSGVTDNRYNRYFRTDYFMPIWENRYNLPVAPESTLFVSYEWRDSMDGCGGATSPVTEFIGIKAEKAARNAIAMCSPRLRSLAGLITSERWGYHPSGNDSKYPVLMGDGSVRVLDDSRSEWMRPFFDTGMPSVHEPRVIDFSPTTVSSWRDCEFFDLVDQYFSNPPLVPKDAHRSGSGGGLPWK